MSLTRILPIGAALVLAVAAILLLGTGGGGGVRLAIVSGSENRALEPIVHEWARETGNTVEIVYQGSVDIARSLEAGAEGIDAVWPAHSLWIELGDSGDLVRHRASILRSPVVLGLAQPIAERLGWIGRTDLTIDAIAEAAASGAFRLAMTSATQSNSGASAYLGFLYAFAGDPDLLTADHLADRTVQERTRSLLSQVDRSSGSSGWLKDSLVANPGAYDAMINYEAVILEANVALTEAGRAPLHLIYPANGLSVADSPLGFVDHGDATKEDAFLALQAHLLSPDVQARIVAEGRRAGLLGLDATADAPIWNAGWGVDLTRAIAPVPTPEAPVIREALRLYQTDLRKPSLTVWLLDVSGSMEGAPLDQLKEAMRLLLDPEAAALDLLQPSARDVTIVLPFNHETGTPTRIDGADPAALARGVAAVNALRADGGTDLYYALGQAFAALKDFADAGTLFDYLPAIVAMTDGASDTGNRDRLLEYMDALGFARDVPIHAIAFGQADEDQLRELNEATIGRLFNAGDDLAGALRSAKGYN